MKSSQVNTLEVLNAMEKQLREEVACADAELQALILRAANAASSKDGAMLIRRVEWAIRENKKQTTVTRRKLSAIIRAIHDIKPRPVDSKRAEPRSEYPEDWD